jgi:hypothetical protein
MLGTIIFALGWTIRWPVLHLLRVRSGMRAARRISARYQMLSGLSDSELAARGMHRADIPQIAARTRGI